MKEKARSVSRDEPLGLSRQSALNDRYFDPNAAPGAATNSSSNKQSRSRSLDNLLTPVSSTATFILNLLIELLDSFFFLTDLSV